MKMLLVPLLLVLALARVHGESADFIPCICPPTDAHPEINVNDGSACPKGDLLAAEIKIENYGNYLVATSLNLRLTFLPDVPEEHKHLPLYIVADTVRVDGPINKDHPQIVVNARKLHVSKRGNIFNARKWTIFASEMEIHNENKFKDIFEAQSISEVSGEMKTGLSQLLDFVEFKAVTTNTFDLRNEACPGIEKKSSNQELDSLTPTFEWLESQGKICADEALLWRLKLVQQYRGSSLEGPLTNTQDTKIENLDSMEADIYTELSNEFWKLERNARMSSKHMKSSYSSHLGSILRATYQLITGKFEKDTSEAVWAERLSILKRCEKAHFLMNDISNAKSTNQEIYRNLNTFWPKENDYEDFRSVIYSLIGQNPNKELLNLRNQWVKIIRSIEQLYHLKNIKFEVTLKDHLDGLRRNTGKETNYQQRLAKWETKQVKSYPENNAETMSTIHLPVVPVEKFISGDFSQRVWISDQRFNNHAHLRVQDITVLIDDLSNEEVRQHLNIVPITNVMYDIDEKSEQSIITSLPVVYPLKNKESSVTPFTLWRLVPDDYLVSKLVGKQSVAMSLVFEMSGVSVPGLDGRMAGDDECLQYQDNPQEFTECKYGGEAPFHLTYDIVSVMHLEEINNLFALKYEHQLNGANAGVVTNVSTEWSASFDNECIDVGIGVVNISKSVKMETILGAPLMYFPPELQGYMELHYELQQCALYTRNIVTDCTTGETKPPTYNNDTLSGTIVLTISLEKVFGEIDEENGKVILDMDSTAVTDIGFSFTNPYGKPKLFEQIKALFSEHFTSTELATIQYNPKFAPPDFVRPNKFFFQTVCEGCTKDTKDEGYLITLYETKSINHVDVQYPKDPHAFGLDHAIPEDVYTAGVFLGAHISFCDVYYHSFQDGLKDQRFNIQKLQSSNPAKPRESELYVKYISDMCIHFGGDVIQEDEATLSIYQRSFEFHTQTTNARSKMDNNKPSAPAGTGEKLGELLAGFAKIMEVCYGGDHCEWWEWLVSWMGAAECLIDLLICVFSQPLTYEDVYEDSDIVIFKEEQSPMQYSPECYSFKFPGMDFVPEVNIKMKTSGNSYDQEVKEDTTTKITEAAKEVLALHLTESPSVSLFSAVNLLFPEMKVIDAKQFYSPGTVMMYGNIVKDYVEIPEFGPDCPPYDPVSGKFVHF